MGKNPGAKKGLTEKKLSIRTIKMGKMFLIIFMIF